MRTNWILYPEARQRLVETGLMQRIEKADELYRFDVLGFVYEDEVVDSIQDMKKDGLFDTIPIEERRAFLKSLTGAFNDRKNSHFLIKRSDGEEEAAVDNEDFLLLSGYRSSLFLSKDELFDYKRFGFSTISEFTGTVGAAIEVTMGRGLNRGAPIWETVRADGRTIASTISGDHNLDLRIIQRDLTAYETIDPFGNKVSYRPETEFDRGFVAAYHTTEGILLAAVLKYVEQIGTKPKSLENGAKDTIKLLASQGQALANAADSWSGSRHPLDFFWAWSQPLPQLDREYKTSDRITYCLPTAHEGTYEICIGPQKELIIAFVSPKSKTIVDARRSVSFVPEDIDKVIEGLFYQTTKGLGRTPGAELVSILSYRFSPQFEKDMASLVRA